jgi:hypothetical protein
MCDYDERIASVLKIGSRVGYALYRVLDEPFKKVSPPAVNCVDT